MNVRTIGYQSKPGGNAPSGTLTHHPRAFNKYLCRPPYLFFLLLGEYVVYFVIPAPAKNLRIVSPILNKTTNSLTVTCLADGLYPEPVIVIHADRWVESLIFFYWREVGIDKE